MTREEMVEAIAKKGNFVFDLSWYEEFLADATNEEIGQIIRAICKYAITGDLEHFEDRGLNIIVKSMSISIQKRTETYIERCNKNRESGQKGGEAKAEKQKQADYPKHYDISDDDLRRLQCR